MGSRTNARIQCESCVLLLEVERDNSAVDVNTLAAGCASRKQLTIEIAIVVAMIL